MRHFMSYIGCLVLASPAMATTWHVAVTGHDSNDGSQASPYATIKHAISQSSNGDTISIAEGTYFEYGIDPFGKEITITGPDRSTYGWPPPVVIDGQGHGSVLSCDSGETSSTVFKNLNIQYGHDDAGGGFYCINDSKPVLENMKFKFNTANQYGGGMYIKGDDITPTGGPTLTNVEFHTNHAGSGGAIYCQNSNPVISTHGFNPGIYKFYNNHSTDNGGAFYFVNSHGTMNGVLINGNQANWGGGIYFMGDSTTTLNQCDISFNEADSGGGIAKLSEPPRAQPLQSDSQHSQL